LSEHETEFVGRSNSQFEAEFSERFEFTGQSEVTLDVSPIAVVRHNEKFEIKAKLALTFRYFFIANFSTLQCCTCIVLVPIS
jgi:hypothetical protein